MLDIETSSDNWQVQKSRVINGKRTSLRLEPVVWGLLDEVASREKCKDREILGLIQYRKTTDESLASAIRQFLMLYFRAAANETGHDVAGHGDVALMKKRVQLNPKF